MKGNLRQKNSISGLMALLVFGIFAVCVMAVLLLGADTYQKLHERDSKAYDERTCVQYMSTRVRQAGNGVEGIVSLGGNDALVLRETIEGEDYLTYIYCYGGWIREYFSVEDPDGMLPDPEFGEMILEAESMKLELDDGLLTAVIAQGGQPLEVKLYLRGSRASADDGPEARTEDGPAAAAESGVAA